MNGSNFRIFIRMFILAISLFCLVWLTKLVADDDVYNFYFQKGGAPNTVIQSGGGQSTGAAALKPPSTIPENASSATHALVENEELKVTSSATAPVQRPDMQKERKPFEVVLGYAGTKDPVGEGRAYSLGMQYNFNPFLAARLQGRIRNFQPDETAANRLGGMASFVLTPFRLDLLGHRLLELSAHAGVDTSRKRGSDERDVSISVDPMIGASALLSLNENFGIEFQVNKSTRASFIGANVALMF
jgi:hypothetical protein